MSHGKVAECESVDLTEDENSLGENPEYEHPVHFVNCAGNLYPLLNASQGDTPAQFLKDATVSCFTEHPKEATTPSDNDSGNEFLNHLSSTPLQDNSQATTQAVLQNDSIYSPQQPPGKVVIIKKNNKYYKIIIPHNVMPNITQSIGSVLINIPEVGPLVISNDPQAAKVKPSQLKQQQLSLNLDAIQQNEGSTSITKSEKPKRTRPPKKFCWSNWRIRKRDLEGFTVYDRLGFNKSEGLEAKKCMHRADSIIRDLEARLLKKKLEYEEFKKSVRNKNKVKLVKINKILKPDKIGTATSSSNLEPDDTDDYGSDLLVTKKVVILNQNMYEPEVKRKSKQFRNSKTDRRKRSNKVKDVSKQAKQVNLEKLNKNTTLKPCLVHLVKDKQVEEAYLKYCKDMDLNMKRKPAINKIKKKLSGKNEKTGKTNNDLEKSFVKKCLKKQNEVFDNTILKSLIIKSEQSLVNTVNLCKPFLILTDRTIEEDLQYYCNEFIKNNIIYIAHSEQDLPKSVLKYKGFICAVEVGYVKLVDANLFSKFVANGMKFPGINKSCDEHSYSLPKHLQA